MTTFWNARSKFRKCAAIFLAIGLSLALYGCDDYLGLSPKKDPAINAYITSIPKRSLIPASPPTKVGSGGQVDNGVVDRRRRLCSQDQYHQQTDFQEIAALDPNTASVYPGALVQGKDLLSGRFAEIPLKRGSTELTITGLAVSKPTVQLSKSVPHVSLADVQQALNSVVADPANIAKGSIARMALDISETHSYEQALLDAGVSASWLSGSFDARLRTVTSSKKSSIIAKFTQVYFEANASAPIMPYDAFDASVSLDSVKKVAYPENIATLQPLDPPLFVKTVKYGRMALISISSDDDVSTLESAVKAAFSALSSSGSMTLNLDQKRILQNSTMDGVVIGGSGNSGAALLSTVAGGTIDGLTKFLNDGATYDPQTSPAAPISYTLTYLSDNSFADSSFSADFSLTGCTDLPIPIEKVQISFHTGDDDLDNVMYPYAILRTANSQVVAKGDTFGLVWGAKWDEHIYTGPYGLDMSGAWNLDNCNGATIEVGQAPRVGQDPEWHMTFGVDIYMAGKWYTVRNASGNENEFSLGDGKANSTSQPLTCPNL